MPKVSQEVLAAADFYFFGVVIPFKLCWICKDLSIQSKVSARTSLLMICWLTHCTPTKGWDRSCYLKGNGHIAAQPLCLIWMGIVLPIVFACVNFHLGSLNIITSLKKKNWGSLHVQVLIKGAPFVLRAELQTNILQCLVMNKLSSMRKECGRSNARM